MPRFIERAESLRDQVATVRESIAATNSKLKEVSTLKTATNNITHHAQLDDSVSGTLESPEAIIEAEERRIADLQAKIADLRKQVCCVIPVYRRRSNSHARKKLCWQRNAQALALVLGPSKGQKHDLRNQHPHPQSRSRMYRRTSFGVPQELP